MTLTEHLEKILLYLNDTNILSLNNLNQYFENDDISKSRQKNEDPLGRNRIGDVKVFPCLLMLCGCSEQLKA